MKKTGILLLLLSLCFSLVGCGNKNSTPAPTDIMIEEAFKNTLKTEEMLSFDKMSEFQFEEIDINDSDMETLQSKFPSRVEYKKYQATFNLISVELDIKANYSAVFVYNNGEWKLSFGYPTNQDEWEYTGKQTVNMQRMLDDLKTTDFDSFDIGYVGDTKYSSIKIDERNTDMSVNRDDVSLTVVVSTDFAEYSIPVDMVYYFNRGEWVLGDVHIADATEWKLVYSDGRAPAFMTDNEVLSYLTVNTNFLTYCANLNYVDDYSINKISEKATKESVIAEYEFKTRYDYLGTVTYSAFAEYEWLDGEWSEPSISVKTKLVDFSDMTKYEWKNDSGNVFSFTESKNDDSSKCLIAGAYNSTPIILNVEAIIRDNNWDALLLDEDNQEIEDLPANAASINLEYSALLYNNMLFTPAEVIIQEEIPEDVSEPQIDTSNDFDVRNMTEEKTFENVISKDGLSFSQITMTPNEDGTVAIKGTVSNQSGATSSYRISAIAYSDSEEVLSEGILKSEAQLTTNSSVVIEFSIDPVELSEVSRIAIYIRN